MPLGTGAAVACDRSLVRRVGSDEHVFGFIEYWIGRKRDAASDVDGKQMRLGVSAHSPSARIRAEILFALQPILGSPKSRLFRLAQLRWAGVTG